ncbi:DNA-binding PucR family transcriptional regulator [Mycobacterium frederiksbergense]|uniref:DNA-binding PucR family transcriptional regulator n=1 Tax=Mycolicibacterium frederiksbergense TaxID=117567 RepID=A0ABT6KYU1_9MYCO|nr:PucR family transcriptional regulator [Mycolicibacterium frederiksbergense]MDH6195831.1 DNA-binding PucR family transcriptional regulator [Mycolicibacterium frederiksbergense]
MPQLTLAEVLRLPAFRRASPVVLAGSAFLNRPIRWAEAVQVADAAPGSGTGQGPHVHRLEDLHLRGLLSLFGDDDRIRLFVDRELGALRMHDASHDDGVGLMAVLQACLRHPTSKTAAASSVHLSRSAFYDRLLKLEQVLEVDLDDPETRASLYVAIVADELLAHTAS